MARFTIEVETKETDVIEEVKPDQRSLKVASKAMERSGLRLERAGPVQTEIVEQTLRRLVAVAALMQASVAARGGV